MNAIRGYFQSKLGKGEEFHRNAMKLNTGRNAFDYILRAKGYKKGYLPCHACKAMIEPVKRLGIECAFYRINANFHPILEIIKGG